MSPAELIDFEYQSYLFIVNRYCEKKHRRNVRFLPNGEDSDTFDDGNAIFTTKFRDPLPGEVRPTVLKNFEETEKDRAWIEKLAKEEGVHGLKWHTTWWGASG